MFSTIFVCFGLWFDMDFSNLLQTSFSPLISDEGLEASSKENAEAFTKLFPLIPY